MTGFAPRDVPDLIEIVAAARAGRTKLAVQGAGSLAHCGRPHSCATLAMAGFSGITDYDPAELVITVGAGTPLALVNEVLADEGQMLGFDAWDHGRLFGTHGQATIGGIVAAGTAGPRRLAGGSVRDHLLGFAAVSGLAEHFKGGGKVVKNVTGFDLSKVMAGSWGRLAALTELTLRVLPRPETAVTMGIEGLGAAAAHAMMAAALGSNIGVSAAAFLPGTINEGVSLTLLEIAGFAHSVRSRIVALTERFGDLGAWHELDQIGAEARWRDIGCVNALDGPTLWQVHVPPSSAVPFMAQFETFDARWLSDWGGGLIWLELEGHHQVVRAAAEAVGASARLVRAPADVRAHIPPFHPRPVQLSKLERRVTEAFDPDGVWNTGRFAESENAD